MTGDLELVDVDFPEDANVILAQSHFIKTVEDVFETLVSNVPGIKFGIAFNEASGPRLVRTEGNDENLISIASEDAKRIGAGHLLVIILQNAFPINVLPSLKAVAEITNIYCATSNPLKAVVVRNGESAALIGVMDGYSPLGVEKEQDKKDRHDFLRRIGYKK